MRKYSINSMKYNNGIFVARNPKKMKRKNSKQNSYYPFLHYEKLSDIEYFCFYKSSEYALSFIFIYLFFYHNKLQEKNLQSICIQFEGKYEMKTRKWNFLLCFVPFLLTSVDFTVTEETALSNFFDRSRPRLVDCLLVY